ncbi:hypothetical protein R1sor_019290 [Riccia sorocarpa]|uniref:Uncharacterized protein n=1 Tax=Riccia sorocarpa TaxID=122646 RepID=A0ABD3IC81_9MARC
MPARKQWRLAWPRVRTFCKEFLHQNVSKEAIKAATQEVEEMRCYLSTNCTEEEIQELSDLENSLQQMEDHEASLWFLKGRSKWLREGEAPTQYFFSLAKARYSQDQIAGLQTADGTKSMVMALGSPRQLGWLRDVGCEVAGAGRRFKFLGVWSGQGISQLEIAEKICDSIKKKLKLWVNRYFSLP